MTAADSVLIADALLAVLEPLTNTEIEKVLPLMARGWSNKHIAEELEIDYSTAIGHVHHIIRKLKASNRTEAVYHAVLLNLISRGSRSEGLRLLRDRLTVARR